MEVTDLSAAELAALLPGRAVRAYPALLSSEVDAEAWARAGGPAGGVVTAGYLAAPRGRAGLPWVPGRGLVFSLLLPDLPPGREGYPYLPAALGLADALGGGRIRWPDEVHGGAGRLGALGVRTGPTAPPPVNIGAPTWAVVTMLAEHAQPPRAPLLATIVRAVEGRLDEPAEALLAAYRERCATLGRRVRARLVPLGPAGPVVEGEAVDVRADGALVIRTAQGRRAVVPPRDLGLLDELDGPPDAPA